MINAFIRPALIRLLGHLEGQLQTAQDRQAFLTSIGVDAAALGEPVRPERALPSPAHPQARDIGTIETLETVRQFVSRLLEYLIGAERIHLVAELVHRVEPRLRDSERNDAKAL